MTYDIRWLGTACFEIRLDNGTAIVIDPYLDDAVSAPVPSADIGACDAIFLTHGHYDHVLDVGKLVRRFDARVYCSREASESLIAHQQVDPTAFRVVTAGDTVVEAGFRAEVVRGVHVDFAAEYHRLTGGDLLNDFGDDIETGVQKALEASFGPVTVPENFTTWMTQYPGGEQLNFVFDFGGENRVYMAGSYPAPALIETAEKTRASLMLLQVLPGNTLKGLESQTLQFALASGARQVVPQHHDPLIQGARPSDLSELKRLFGRHDVAFTEFEPGRWYRYG